MSQLTKFIPTTKEEQEQVVREIETIAKLAYVYHGKVIGDYLIDILIPRYYDKTHDIKLKEIVILMFPSTGEREEFLKLTDLKHSRNDIYQLIKFNRIIVEFEVTTVQEIRYSTDYLYAIYPNAEWVFDTFCNQYTLNAIMFCIKSKRVSVFQYETSLLRSGDKEASQRLLSKFLNKGWTAILYVDAEKAFNCYELSGIFFSVNDLIGVLTEPVIKENSSHDILKDMKDLEESFHEVELNINNIFTLKKDVGKELVDIKDMMKKLRKKIEKQK